MRHKLKLSPTKSVMLVISLLYLFTLRGVSGNLNPSQYGIETRKNRPPFETSMERGRYAQVYSLAEHSTFAVDQIYPFLTPDVAWYNGHFYSTFPPAAAMLAVPFYLLGKVVGLAQVFTYASSALFSLLTALIIIKIGLKLNFSFRSSVFSAIVYALASVAWPYSVSFSAHTLSALTLAASLLAYLYVNDSKNSKLAILAVFSLFALNLFVDYPNLLIFIPIVVATKLSKIRIREENDSLVITGFKELLIGLLPVGIFLALFVGYNMSHYNRPIAFANTYSIKFLADKSSSIEKLQLSNELIDNHSYVAKFSPKQTLQGIGILLVSHDRGLIMFSPIFLIALHGLYVLIRQKNKLALVILVTFILNVLIYASYDDPWGGWAFGPRYLIVSFPLLAILCGAAFEDMKNRHFFSKVLIYLLLVFSSVVSLIGALTTNAVPPSIEVHTLGLPDNYIHNWNYLLSNGTSSFINNWMHISPVAYFVILALVVLIFEGYIVFKHD